MSNSGFGAGRGIGRGVGRGGFPVFTASGGTGLPAYVQHSAVQRAAPPAPTAQSSWIKIATGRGAGGSSEHGPGQVSATPAQQRRRLKSAEENYFDDVDDDEGESGKAAGNGDNSDEDDPLDAFMADIDSTVNKQKQKSSSRLQEETNTNETEDDPLDAFMADIDSTVKKQQQGSQGSASSKTSMPSFSSWKQQKPASTAKAKGIGQREDLEEEDPMESYLRHVKKAKEEEEAKESNDKNNEDELNEEDKEDQDFDAFEKLFDKDSKRVIEPLPLVDHATVKYEPFKKEFYDEHPEVFIQSEEEIQSVIKGLGLRVSGNNVPRPVQTWTHLMLPDLMMKDLTKFEYKAPTGIQCQTLPILLSGRDVIGIAATGSGKTAAFVIPMVVHVRDAYACNRGDGPVGLVISPTRELAQQIYTEVRKFSRRHDIRTVAVFGGVGKYDQSLELKKGCDILVATPGRLIDHVKEGATNLRRVTYLVLDEADRMFQMGFESQVRSIVKNCRPDKQTALFSATFKKRVEQLAREYLHEPVRVVVGGLGEANTDVTQMVQVFPPGMQKIQWLTQKLRGFVSQGSVLVFVGQKITAENLGRDLGAAGFNVASLHGDKSQIERDQIYYNFKRGDTTVLVATDVAARGLDVKTVRTVVAFDPPRDKDSHTHRIGRTGRMGEKGTAWTLIEPKDVKGAGIIVTSLEEVGQYVQPGLIEIAEKDPVWRNSRMYKASGTGGRGRGQAVLDFRKDNMGITRAPGASGGGGGRKPGRGGHPNGPNRSGLGGRGGGGSGSGFVSGGSLGSHSIPASTANSPFVSGGSLSSVAQRPSVHMQPPPPPPSMSGNYMVQPPPPPPPSNGPSKKRSRWDQ